jgi:hypothetical protein
MFLTVPLLTSYFILRWIIISSILNKIEVTQMGLKVFIAFPCASSRSFLYINIIRAVLCSIGIVLLVSQRLKSEDRFEETIIKSFSASADTN